MDAIKSSSGKPNDGGSRRRPPGDGRPRRARPTGAHAARGVTVTPEERHHMIASVAYFCAERRGFAPGSELDDWLRAEREIDELLRGHATQRVPENE